MQGIFICSFRRIGAVTGKPDSGISLGCHAGDISVGCWTPGYTGNIGNIFVRCLVLVMLTAADYFLS